MVYSDLAWDDLRKENDRIKAENAALKDALQTQVYHFDEAMNNEDCGPWFEAVQNAKKLLK